MMMGFWPILVLSGCTYSRSQLKQDTNLVLKGRRGNADTFFQSDRLKIEVTWPQNTSILLRATHLVQVFIPMLLVCLGHLYNFVTLYDYGGQVGQGILKLRKKKVKTLGLSVQMLSSDALFPFLVLLQGLVFHFLVSIICSLNL